jgi:hypothetical protein
LFSIFVYPLSFYKTNHETKFEKVEYTLTFLAYYFMPLFSSFEQCQDQEANKKTKLTRQCGPNVALIATYACYASAI